MHISGQNCAPEGPAPGACAACSDVEDVGAGYAYVGGRLDAERARMPCGRRNAEVVTQLVEEGMFFRRMNRDPPKRSRPKRVPFPISLD